MTEMNVHLQLAYDGSSDILKLSRADQRRAMHLLYRKLYKSLKQDVLDRWKAIATPVLKHGSNDEILLEAAADDDGKKEDSMTAENLCAFAEQELALMNLSSATGQSFTVECKPGVQCEIVNRTHQTAYVYAIMADGEPYTVEATVTTADKKELKIRGRVLLRVAYHHEFHGGAR